MTRGTNMKLTLTFRPESCVLDVADTRMRVPLDPHDPTAAP
jgi:hypothetical protein